MKYSRFEALLIILGGATIVAGMLLSSPTDLDPAEVVAQLLVVFVLGGALHWGRNGGFIAALIATLVYVFMRLPFLMIGGFSVDIVTRIVLRVLTYGIVGIVGGELFGRMKYVLARLEGSPLVDQVTGVYNARYAGAAIRSGVAHWHRYQAPYSVVTLSLETTLLHGLRPERKRILLRQVAGRIRNDIRMVDDLAHRTEGCFLVMLPHTDARGAAVCGDRLHRGVVEMLGVKETSVSANALSSERDHAALSELAAILDPEEASPPGAPVGAAGPASPDPTTP